MLYILEQSVLTTRPLHLRFFFYVELRLLPDMLSKTSKSSANLASFISNPAQASVNYPGTSAGARTNLNFSGILGHCYCFWLLLSIAVSSWFC